MAVATSLDNDLTLLLEDIRSRCVNTDGPYRLGSGGTSPYYLNLRVLLNDGEALARIGRLILSRLPADTDAVGGMMASSIPISSAVLLLNVQTHKLKKDLRGFWVRQEEKQHGLGGLVSGKLRKNDRVVIVDDVTTEGNSVMRVADEVRKLGGRVLKVVVVVDREEGAAELLRSHRITFDPIFTSAVVLGK
jgi:orotate phosphoribosyltransferase